MPRLDHLDGAVERIVLGERPHLLGPVWTIWLRYMTVALLPTLLASVLVIAEVGNLYILGFGLAWTLGVGFAVWNSLTRIGIETDEEVVAGVLVLTVKSIAFVALTALGAMLSFIAMVAFPEHSYLLTQPSGYIMVFTPLGFVNSVLVGMLLTGAGLAAAAIGVDRAWQRYREVNPR